MQRMGGRRQATGAIPVVQHVVERVLRFHHLFAGKSKWEIRVGNEHAPSVCWPLALSLQRKISLLP